MRSKPCGDPSMGHLKTIDGSLHGLERMYNTPVAPNLEQIMGQAYQTPLATDVVEAAQQKAAETARFFDLAKYRFHDDLAPGVQCLACRRPHFRRHACFRGDGLLRHGRLWIVVALTPGRHGRIEP